MAGPFDDILALGFEDEQDFLNTLPDPAELRTPAERFGDYGRAIAAAPVSGILGLGERTYMGLAGLADAAGFSQPRDFLLEQGYAAQGLREDLSDWAVDPNVDGALSGPGLAYSGISGALEFAPALANPFVGGAAIAGTGGARRYYDLPLQGPEVPTTGERLTAAATTGAFEGLGAALPVPGINKALPSGLAGAREFLTRTAKTAGINTPFNVGQTVAEMGQNEAYAGAEYSPEEYQSAALTAAGQGAALAPVFTGMGALGARGKRVPDLGVDFDAQVAREATSGALFDGDGSDSGLKLLPAPQTGIYGPDASFVMGETPPYRPPLELPAPQPGIYGPDASFVMGETSTSRPEIPPPPPFSPGAPALQSNILAKPDGLTEDAQGSLNVKPSRPLSEQGAIQAAAKQAAETRQPVILEGTVEQPIRIVADEDSASRVETWAKETGQATDVNRQLVDEVSRPPVGASRWVETKDIAARPDLMQFRRGTEVDARTGAEASRKVGPEELWDSVKAGRLLVWEPKDRAAYGLSGDEKYIVVNGHNRLASANEKSIAKMQIEVIREADGWSSGDAVAYGAEVNIAQGDAKPLDIIRFYRNYAESRGRDAALERGRAIGLKGQKHLAVALEAEAPLYSNVINEKVSVDQAYAIVKEAEGNSNYQNVGLEYALKNPDADNFSIISKIQSEKFVDSEIRGKEGPVMFPDPIPPEIKKQALFNVTNRLRRDLSGNIQALASAKQAEKANKSGRVQVTDVAGALSDLQGFERERRALKSWNDIPEIRAKVLSEYKAEADKLNKEAKRQQKLDLRMMGDESGAISSDILVPKWVEKARQWTGDNVSELWGSLRGFDEGRTLEPSQAFFEGEGFRVLPKVMQGGARRKLVFPRTLAEKFPSFDRVYRNVTDTRRMESVLANEGFKRLQSYLKLGADQRAKIDRVMVGLRKAHRDSPPGTVKELGDEALGRLGFDPEMIGAYRSVRQFSDWSLSVVRDTLKAYTENLPPEDRAIAQADIDAWILAKRDSFYVPFVRPRGKWAVQIQDAEGNTTYYSTHATNAEARRIKAKLAPEAEIKQIASTASKDTMGMPLDVQIALGGFLENNKEKPSLKGFRARLAKARLVDGFNTDLAPGLADYALSMSKWASLVHGAPEVYRAIGEMGESQKGLKEYAVKYWEDYKKGADPLASGVLRFMNAYNLAAVPASGLVNSTQTFTTTLALLTSRRWGGNAKDAPEILARAMKDASEHALGSEKYANKSAANAERAAALKLGLESGDLEAQAMGDLARVRRGNSTKPTLYDRLMMTFTLTEQWNRRVAFLAGFELGKKQGIPFKDAVNFGKEFVLTTQFDMSDANRPELFRSGLGRVLSQYKTFSGNMLRFMRNSVEKKDWAPLATTLAMQSMFAGARGLPFAAVTIGLIDSAFGVNTLEEIRKLWANEKAATTFLYGLPAGAAGINTSPSTGLGDLFPAIDDDPAAAVLKFAVGPVGQLPMKALKAKEAMDLDAPWNAVANVAPRFLRGPIKAAEYLSTGQLSDPRGDPLLEQTGDVLTDAYRTGVIGMGFPPTDYTTTYEKRFAKTKLEERARDNDDINLRYFKALKAGDSERMREIMQESLDSFSKSPDQWKRIDPEAVKQFYLPEDVRSLKRSPKEIRPMMLELERLYGRR